MRLSFFPSTDPSKNAEWDIFLSHWFSGDYGANFVNTLTIISPKADDKSTHYLAEDARWKEIVESWWQIKTSLPGTQLRAWRVIHKYGDEIAPNLRVFRMRESSSSCLFWLSPYQDLIETQARLADLLPTISAYWHIMQDRGLFHAAGILHKERAYLFVGVSGAGKSTVSSLSSARGDMIIHDDHVVVCKGEARIWSVTDASHSIQGTAIKAIFFLIQDQQDRLLPINKARTAKGLIKSLHEHGKHALFGDVLQNAFSICTDISRKVPGFQLHFRKSPDFWKLIDEHFPE